MRPVMAAPSKNLDRLVHQVNLDAVAVELDLMDPAIAGGHFVSRRCKRRFYESGVGSLHADYGSLLTLHAANSNTKRVA